MGVWRGTIAATTLGGNLVLNPIFVTDTAGWDLAFGTDTATRVSDGASNGTWCVRGTEGKADSGLSQLPADMEPVTPGGMVLMGADVKVNINAAQFKLWMGFAEYNAAKTFLAWNPFIAFWQFADRLGMVNNVWKRLSGRITVRADTAFVSIHLRGNRDVPIAGAWAAFDDIFLGEIASSAPVFVEKGWQEGG